MEWAELRAEVRALQADRDLTPTAVAYAGATLIHRALDEMYIGEPEALRTVAWAIAQAQPTVVALRNVGVSVVTTAREARVGDRMAAAGRSAQRLARLLSETPRQLGRRGQPVLRETVATAGYSMSVRAALFQGKERVRRVVSFPLARRDGRMAHELAGAGLAVTAARPAESGTGPTLEGVDVVLLGCVAFLADGSIVAEPGTLALVERARDQDIPVHFFADTLKLAPWLPSPKASDEAGEGWDIVPSQYVGHVVTEDGIRRPDQLLAAAADLAPRWRAFEPADRS